MKNSEKIINKILNIIVLVLLVIAVYYTIKSQSNDMLIDSMERTNDGEESV